MNFMSLRPSSLKAKSLVPISSWPTRSRKLRGFKKINLWRCLREIWTLQPRSRRLWGLKILLWRRDPRTKKRDTKRWRKFMMKEMTKFQPLKSPTQNFNKISRKYRWNWEIQMNKTKKWMRWLETSSWLKKSLTGNQELYPNSSR